MAGCSIWDVEASIACCKSSQKLQARSNFSVGLEQSLKGCAKYDTSEYQSPFDEFISLCLEEICPTDCFRPLPPILGNGLSLGLLKLFFLVKKKGGYDSEHGVGFGFGLAIKFVCVEYLELLVRGLARLSEHGGFQAEIWSSSLNVDGLLMDLDTKLEGFVSRVIDKRRKSDECFYVEKGKLSSTDGCVLRRETKSLKIEKCKINCANTVSSVMSGNKRKSSYEDVVEDVIKGSVNSNAPVKCSEEDNEDMVVQDTSMPKDFTIHKRKRDCLSRMLHWMAITAKDPTEPGIGSLPESSKWKSYGNDVCWKQVLSAREVLFLKRIGVSDAGQPVWKKKQRMHPSMYDDDQPASTERLRSSSRLEAHSPCQSSSSTTTLSDPDASPGSFMKKMEVQLNQRSLRPDCSFLKSICPNNHVRKRIPVGQYFQAEVPEWTGKKAPKSESDLKWLGTRVWPLEGRETVCVIERDPIGKGRVDSCGCQVRGSVECIGFHVGERRLKVKRELGSAFYHWNFDKMGEEVTLSWTEEEEKKFRSIVKANPQSKNKCFWVQMSKSLPTKSRRDQISYYYNVFLLRRRGYQNRCGSGGDIDSDDDETETEFGSSAANGFGAGISCSTYSILGTPRKKANVSR